MFKFHLFFILIIFFFLGCGDTTPKPIPLNDFEKLIAANLKGDEKALLKQALIVEAKYPNTKEAAIATHLRSSIEKKRKKLKTKIAKSQPIYTKKEKEKKISRQSSRRENSSSVVNMANTLSTPKGISPLISIVNTPRKVQKAIPSSNGAINVSPDYIEEEQKKKQKDLTFEKDIPLNKKMKEKTTSLTPKEMRKEFIEKTLSKLKMTKSNAGTHSFYTFPRKSFPGYFYIVRTKKDEFYLRSVIKIKTSSKPKKLYLVGGLQGYEIKLDGKNQYLSNGFFTKDILIKDSEIEAFEKIFSRDFVQAVYRKNGRNKMANFTENTQIEILSILNIYKSLLTVY